MKRKWMNPKFLFLGLYILAVLLYLGASIFRWQRGKAADEPKLLSLEDFSMVSILPVEGTKTKFVSTDQDPQLIYTQESPFSVGRVTFSVSSNKPGGEIVLYYAQDESYLTDGFREKDKIWAKQLSDGTWYFDLDGKKVQALRFDPDTTGGIVWTVDNIVLNAQKPVAEYFVPSGLSAAMLLALPLLVGSILLYIGQLWQGIRQDGVSFVSFIFSKRKEN